MSDTAGRWRGCGLSDVGRVRSSNQDAFALFDDRGMWVVADGMGGHAGGNVASRLAVEAVASSSASLPAGTPHQDEAAILRQAVSHANQAIRQEAVLHPELTGMGTTLVLLRITGHPVPQAIIAHVGDSRAYLIRKDVLTQLTQDHSWVEEQIRQGNLDPREADRHPMRHVLTRAVGTEAAVVPDITVHRLEAHDQILLCTDGLTKMLGDEEILRVLRQTGTDGDKVCHALIQQANERGGQDNTTVVTVALRP
jgi:protein phosphatase